VDLKRLLAAHPRIHLAAPQESAELAAFFANHSMEGGAFRVRYERGPDFFAFLRCQSDHFYVFVGRDRQGRILGLGTLSLRTGYIGGECVKVGYLGDLRVVPGRESVVLWRRFLSDLLKQGPFIDEFGGCRHFLTAVIDQNRSAANALIGPRTQRHGFRYARLAGYRMVNLVARLPGAARSAFGGGIARARSSDLGEITAWLAAHHQKIPFGFAFDEGELERRLHRWPGLEVGSFFVARDPQGRLVGTASVWSPEPVKRIVVERLPWALAAASRFVRGLPRAGETMKVHYLTHVAVESAEVFRALIDSIWKARSVGILSFHEFESPGHSRTPAGYVAHTIPMSLYAVTGIDEGSEEDLRPVAREVGFEMALV
jgi:hypothetical protein